MTFHHFSAPPPVVYPETLNKDAGGIVHAPDFYFHAFTAEFKHGLIQRIHGGNVPEVSLRHINDYAFKRLAEVEVIHEAVS